MAASTDTIAALIDRWSKARVVALTGAGISTESGIPDYRGEGTRARARQPIQHGEFVGSAEVRQRYWARSFLGVTAISNAVPNAGHTALAQLEERDALIGIITQNVDRLHTKAGSQRVVELHGALADVVCLNCGAKSSRSDLQLRLVEANRGWSVDDDAGTTLPDGDHEFDSRAIGEFVVVGCEACGGALKPDVVFFGGAVAKPILESAWELYREADVVVVVGSSLAVYSGFRFIRQAAQDNRDVLIINLGETRGDPFASLKIESPAGSTLEAVCRELG